MRVEGFYAYWWRGTLKTGLSGNCVLLLGNIHTNFYNTTEILFVQKKETYLRGNKKDGHRKSLRYGFK